MEPNYPMLQALALLDDDLAGRMPLVQALKTLETLQLAAHAHPQEWQRALATRSLQVIQNWLLDISIGIVVLGLYEQARQIHTVLPGVALLPMQVQRIEDMIEQCRKET